MSKGNLREEVKTVKAAVLAWNKVASEELQSNEEYSEVIQNRVIKARKFLAESPESNDIYYWKYNEIGENKRIHSGKSYRETRHYRNYKINENTTFEHQFERNKSASRRIIMAGNRLTQSHKSLGKRRRK